MAEWKVYLIVVPIALIVGAIIGFLITRYIFTKQLKEWQKKMEEPDKEQVRNMLAALGKKPSEEQVNRFINMSKNSAKKNNKNNSKKDSSKTKKNK